MLYNTDGSLGIYLQAGSPGPDREADWLSCPPSWPFNMTIRVYQPEQGILDGCNEDNLVVQGWHLPHPADARAPGPRHA